MQSHEHWGKWRKEKKKTQIQLIFSLLGWYEDRTADISLHKHTQKQFAVGKSSLTCNSPQR